MIRHVRRHAGFAIDLASTAIALVALSVVRAHGRTPRGWRVVGWTLVGLFVIGVVVQAMGMGAR